MKWLFGSNLTRWLENDILWKTVTDKAGMVVLTFEENKFYPVKVSIMQLYGGEINDFAVSVAKTVIVIAELQMLHEKENIL